MIQFTYPFLLFGLFVLLIPVIIHLFNFRRYKKVYFSDIRFLQAVQIKSSKQQKLKYLLILISRILAITSLIFAFAQPYFASDKNIINAGTHAVSIFVDNSFSMEHVSEQGNIFDEAKKKAKEIIQAYQPDDEFQILTNDFEGKHQRWLTKNEFLQELDEISISPVSKNLSQIVSRQSDLLKNTSHNNQFIYIISDFQKENFQLVNGLHGNRLHIIPNTNRKAMN